MYKFTLWIKSDKQNINLQKEGILLELNKIIYIVNNSTSFPTIKCNGHYTI